jgi:enoyl-CoA hydratase
MPVRTEVVGRVLVITLNRPEVLNAINAALARSLIEAVEELDANPELAVGVLAGSERAFSSGMDLKEFASLGAPAGFQQLLHEGSAKPLIAAVEGFALAGGLELVLTCDIVVASTAATFGIPEAAVGLIAAGGTLARLPRRVPYGFAMTMALTGQPVAGGVAHAKGLVDVLTEPGAALPTAMALADRIAANAPLAVAASKRLVRATGRDAADEYWQLQQHWYEAIVRSDDAREGALAFTEKRTPRWVGH